MAKIHEAQHDPAEHVFEPYSIFHFCATCSHTGPLALPHTQRSFLPQGLGWCFSLCTQIAIGQLLGIQVLLRYPLLPPRGLPDQPVSHCTPRIPIASCDFCLHGLISMPVIRHMGTPEKVSSIAIAVNKN